MIDQLFAQLKNEDDLIIPDDDENEDFSSNPMEDEEALKEAQFLEQCMSVLNDVKQNKDKKNNSEENKEISIIEQKRI